MLTFVIILSAIAALSFLITLVLLIIYIISAIKNDPVKKKAKFRAFLISAIIWIIFVIVDTSLIVVNRAELFDTAIKSTANIAANGLGTTAANLGKYYDESVIKRFENLDISVDSYSVKEEDGEKVYTVDLTFNNQSPSNEKLYSHILVENNYLVACDQDDYTCNIYLDDDDYYDVESDIIIKGKSKHIAEVIVPKDTEIEYLWYLEKELPLINEK